MECITLDTKVKLETSSAQTAEYIAAHIQEMAHLARRSNMSRLVYFLEMAQIEAQDIANQIRVKSS